MSEQSSNRIDDLSTSLIASLPFFSSLIALVQIRLLRRHHPSTNPRHEDPVQGKAESYGLDGPTSSIALRAAERDEADQVFRLVLLPPVFQASKFFS